MELWLDIPKVSLPGALFSFADSSGDSGAKKDGVHGIYAMNAILIVNVLYNMLMLLQKGTELSAPSSSASAFAPPLRNWMF